MPAPELTRFWRRCRTGLRWCRGLVLFLALLGAAAFFFLNRVGVPRFLKDRLETELRARGVDMRLDRVRLQGFRVFAADNVLLGGETNRPGLHLFMRKAELRLKADALRQLRFELEAIALEHAQLSLVALASNAPPARLDLDDLAMEVRFPTHRQWELSHLRGRLLQAQLEVSGMITNPAALMDWLAPSEPLKADEVSQTWLHPLITLLEKIQLDSRSSLTAHIQGDGADPSSFRVNLRSRIPRAETPWGKAEQLQMNATLAPSPRKQDLREIQLSLTFDQAQTEWASQDQGRVNAALDWSATDPNDRHAEWRWRNRRTRSAWGEADHLDLIATTRRATNGIASFLTEFRLESGSLRGQWGQSSTNLLTGTILHSAPPQTAWDTTWNLATKRIDTRWGSTDNANLRGRARRSELREPPARAKPTTPWWTQLEPIQIEWEARLPQIQSPEMQADRLELTGQWRAPNLVIPKLRLELYGGQVEASGQLDLATRELQADARLDFDFRRLPVLTATHRLAWLRELHWDVAPRIGAQGRLILPAWTNAAPNWRRDLLPTLELSGTVECTNTAYRGWPAASARSDFTVTNLVARARRLRVASPQGSVQLDYEWNLHTDNFRSEIQSQLDPTSLSPVLGPGVIPGLEFFTFTQPPLVRGSVWGSWRQPGTIGFSAQVAATNFTFRGERCQDLRASAGLTNGILHLADVRILRGEQEIIAPEARFDPVRGAIFVTNAVSTVDPDWATMLVGPKIRAAIAPYRFEKPPLVRVNGWIPTRDTDQADVRFQVEGQLFHYWKFHLPEVSGEVHWRGDSLTISNVNARFYGGRLAWSGSFDFTPPQGTDFSFHGTVLQADLRSLMADLSAMTNRMEGVLDGHLTITAANSTSERTWRGGGDAQLRDGFLGDIPIFGFMSPYLDRIAPGLGSSRASAATATFRLQDGVIHTSDLEARSPTLRLQYDGTVDLNGAVDTRMQAEILRDAWGIGRLVSLALWPLTKVFEYHITGTLEHPQSQPLYFPKFLLWPLKPLQTLRQILPSVEPR